mgnify:CR=1 FL=1
MVSFTYIIKDKFGIHARPGLLLVQEAGKLTSNITIFKGTDSGDANVLCYESCSKTGRSDNSTCGRRE